MWRAASVVMFLGIGCGSDPAPAKLAAVDDQGAAVASLTLPGAPVGEVAMVGKVHVTNTGSKPSGPLALAIAGDAAADFALDAATSCSGLVLAPGDDCDIVVRFSPSHGGDRAASLSVMATPGGAATVALVGTGIAPTIQIQSALAFPIVEVGMQGLEHVDIQNTGATLAHIGTIKVIGPSFGRSNTSCNAVLLPQTTCNVELGFVPPAVGTATGSLVVGISATDYTVALTGTGGGRVTVTLAGAGTGRVTSAPAGIDCGTTCTMLAATDLVLTATPANGSTFAGWSRAGCTGTTCTVPASGSPQTITATFQ